MMKYGIVTHYSVLNHGAVLQLEALIKVLKGIGVDAKALQYERNYDYTDNKLKSKYRIGIGSIGYFMKFIKERGLCDFFFLFKKKNVLARYRRYNNFVGPDYQESEPLDGVIVGSDEVFALDIGKTPALFGYGLPSKKVFAYAGSFGSTTLNEIEQKGCKAFIANGLKGMCGLSMRDKNSVAITENLLGRKPEMVCDPVILYGFKKEMAGMRCPLGVKYMVVYSYDQNMNTPDEISSIMKFAKEKGLMVVSPTFYHKWADKCPNVDPMGLLNWFLFAEYVVTDTFHGCVMSMIAQKEFVTYVRGNGNKIESLLNDFGLETRKLIDWKYLCNLFCNKIIWSDVENRIRKQRDNSMNWLKNMVEL